MDIVTGKAAPKIILLCAAVLQVLLFFSVARQSVVDLFVPRPLDQSFNLGPFSSGADLIGYYGWLRSPLVDGDFEFADEHELTTFQRVPEAREHFQRTITGRTPNIWSVGPAFAWAPATIVIHLILKGMGDRSPWLADGYSAPYHLAVGATTLILSLVSLWLAYRLASLFAAPLAAASAAALITLATPVVAYGSTIVAMAHGPATTALLLFVYVWAEGFGRTSASRWVLVGGLLGVACLMRWQLATYAMLPAFEALWIFRASTSWSARARVVGLLLSCSIASLLLFSPQLIGWQIIYGHPILDPHHAAHSWLLPSLWSVLFSTDRSLFYWTPVTAPAFAALIVFAGRFREPRFMILAAGILIQIYAVAAIVGKQVFLGASFGFRFLTETCALLVVGAALLLDNVNRETARRLTIAGGLLAIWNVLLLLAVLRSPTGNDPVELFKAVAQYVRSRPLDAVMVIAIVAGLVFQFDKAWKKETKQLVPVGP